MYKIFCNNYHKENQNKAGFYLSQSYLQRQNYGFSFRRNRDPELGKQYKNQNKAGFSSPYFVFYNRDLKQVWITL